MEWLLIVIVLLFGLTVLRGAPYVPTHRARVEEALDLLNLQPGDVVVDLGSGDGVFLKAAAERGLKAYGYEINPILCAISWLRCFKHRKHVRILWRDFWLSDLPKNTKGVFIFAGGPFMKRLSSKLTKRGGPLKVVSYGFELPDVVKRSTRGGMHLYTLGVLSAATNQAQALQNHNNRLP